MIDHRPFTDLGRFDNEWLAARYHFSFSDYHNPNRMNFGKIRVWNDDTVAPHQGFGLHPHKDMEIITYIREGAITHRDNLGNEGRTDAGDVQVMSAGSGIFHAELNNEDIPCLLYQIWIIPDQRGGTPYWKTAHFPKSDRAGDLVTLASGDPDDIARGALPIRADAKVFGATVQSGQSITLNLANDRGLYLALVTGSATVNNVTLAARDGAAIRSEPLIKVSAMTDSELVLVETPL